MSTNPDPQTLLGETSPPAILERRPPDYICIDNYPDDTFTVLACELLGIGGIPQGRAFGGFQYGPRRDDYDPFLSETDYQRLYNIVCEVMPGAITSQEWFNKDTGQGRRFACLKRAVEKLKDGEWLRRPIRTHAEAAKNETPTAIPALDILPGGIKYGTATVELSGKPLACIRALDDAWQNRLDWGTLRNRVWGEDTYTERRTIMNAIKDARRALRKLARKAGRIVDENYDPLPCVDRGRNLAWKLSFPE